jgi:agmatine deiminase
MKFTSPTSEATDTPQALRMPAEWEPHQATWLAWPNYGADWPGKFEPIPWVYAEIIRHLAQHERVELIVNNAASARRARKVLDHANAWSKNVRFHRWPTNRVWTRDSGCTFVTGKAHVGADALVCPAERSSADTGRHGLSRAETALSVSSRAKSRACPEPAEGDPALAAIKWRFNAWSKYPNWKHDEKIGSLIAEAAHTREFRPMFGKNRVVLEGGSIDVNGQGTLLTTEECLLSRVQQRNPGMKKADYEQVFAEYLGIRNVIWLGSGIVGDDTHGHIDDLTRFVAPDTVVTVVESNPDDPNYQPLRENIRRLREATDQNGKPLSIIELPMPCPVHFRGTRLPASYANFYIANGVVLVPVFNDPNDRFALDILADLFPDREIIGIYCGDLVWGFGTIHCMTQQQPALSR